MYFFLILLGCAVLGGIGLVILHPSSTTRLRAEVEDAKSRVIVNDGSYSVKFDDDFSPNMTFAELAHRLIPPWYEASLMAIDSLDETMKPSKVDKARKALLHFRDLLDAFSPVFAKSGLWKKLRRKYKIGYEVVGYFKDLTLGKFTAELIEERRQHVLDWKVDFLDFVKDREIRKFLYKPFPPYECTFHKASHLFWAGFKKLPCGHDLATDSLKTLGRVQLTSCLEYWDTVQNYDNVVQKEREIVFHNLRKELRIFLEEQPLFGPVMLSNADLKALEVELNILDRAQTKLGHINDLWTAYDTYVTRKTHKEKQIELEGEIKESWLAFLDWANSKDLGGTIQSVLDMLQ